MKSYLRKAVSLLLVVVLCFSGAAAFSSNIITTKFEYILWQIESNSLYTQDKEMSRAEINKWNKYLEQNPDKLEQVVNDYLKTLDSHSMYLSGEKYEEGFSQLVGYVGIGVSLQQTPEGVIVSSVNRSGPAYQAGVRAGDRIMAIDGKDVTNMTSSQLAALSRGEAGTKVMITVQRDGESLTFNLIRKQIQQEYVSAQTVADGVEYIRIESIGSMGDLEDFKNIWNDVCVSTKDLLSNLLPMYFLSL